MNQLAPSELFMAGKTDADPYTNEIPFKKIPDYVAACKQDLLHGSRLGIPENGLKNPIGKDFNMEAIMETFERTLLLLKDNGATIIGNAKYPKWDDLYTMSPQGIYKPAEYATDMTDYFSGLEYLSCDIGNCERVAAASAINSPEVQSAKNHVLSLAHEGGIDAALDFALILPSIIYSGVPGFAGYPAINVPMGPMPDDIPIVKNPRWDLVSSECSFWYLLYQSSILAKVGSQRQPIILPKPELRDIVKYKNA